MKIKFFVGHYVKNIIKNGINMETLWLVENTRYVKGNSAKWKGVKIRFLLGIYVQNIMKNGESMEIH